MGCRYYRSRAGISIHALREEGDRFVRGRLRFTDISIHALREEGDRLYRHWLTDRKEFLSTPSARRATGPKHRNGGNEIFLSTPSARRATRRGREVAQFRVISIHALREEGDPCFLDFEEAGQAISIHALREEGD